MTRVMTLINAALVLLAADVAKADSELFLYNWSNYFPPELLAAFEAETGVAVTLDVYDSNETMLAKLRAGATGYDVVVVAEDLLAVLIEAGLVERIDASRMAHFRLVAAPHDAPPGDPERAYSAPYLWGTTGFTYNSAKVEGGALDASWREVFEPRAALRGRIAMLGDAVEVWNAAAHYLGIATCTEEPSDAQAILELLETQEPFVAAYNSDGTIDRMSAGEVIVHQQWNGASHRTRQTLPTAIYVYPEEGVTFWADNFVVAKGAPNLENAQIFIDWMMAPENAAAASNFTGYMSAIDGSDAFMDEALTASPAIIMPAEHADRLRPKESCSIEAHELRNEMWMRLKV